MSSVVPDASVISRPARTAVVVPFNQYLYEEVKREETQIRRRYFLAAILFNYLDLVSYVATVGLLVLGILITQRPAVSTSMPRQAEKAITITQASLVASLGLTLTVTASLSLCEKSLHFVQNSCYDLIDLRSLRRQVELREHTDLELAFDEIKKKRVERRKKFYNDVRLLFKRRSPFREHLSIEDSSSISGMFGPLWILHEILEWDFSRTQRRLPIIPVPRNDAVLLREAGGTLETANETPSMHGR